MPILEKCAAQGRFKIIDQTIPFVIPGCPPNVDVEITRLKIVQKVITVTMLR